jgi:hypothetical protein
MEMQIILVPLLNLISQIKPMEMEILPAPLVKLSHVNQWNSKYYLFL